jgi:hypothetical protein
MLRMDAESSTVNTHLLMLDAPSSAASAGAAGVAGRVMTPFAVSTNQMRDHVVIEAQ